MQNIKINRHSFRFIEIETGYVAKPTPTAINRVPISALEMSNRHNYDEECSVIFKHFYITFYIS